MSKHLDKNEIDLSEVFIIVWKKKLTVGIFVFISLALIFSNHVLKEPPKLMVSVTTEIRPISVYDDAKYNIYNSIIKAIEPFFLKESIHQSSQGIFQDKDIKYQIIETQIKDLQINNINKEFLLDLFIDSINEKSNIISLIKKFNYLNREEYSNIVEYENAVSKLASSILLKNVILKNGIEKNYLTLNYSNVEKWEDFLKFVGDETNLEIQKRLLEMFNNYLSYLYSIKTYEMEDIDTQLEVITNVEQKNNLLNKKKILLENRYIERMKSTFDSSPLSKSDSFYAAKINHSLTNYIKQKKDSIKVKLIVAGICGAILGIFFVLITNVIQKRKK